MKERMSDGLCVSRDQSEGRMWDGLDDRPL